MEGNIKKVTLPIISIKGSVLFPHISASLDIIRENEIASVKETISNHDELIVITTEIDSKKDEFDKDNLYDIGVVARIRSSRQNPDGSYKISVVALDKVKIFDIYEENNINLVNFSVVNDVQVNLKMRLL